MKDLRSMRSWLIMLFLILGLSFSLAQVPTAEQMKEPPKKQVKDATMDQPKVEGAQNAKEGSKPPEMRPGDLPSREALMRRLIVTDEDAVAALTQYLEQDSQLKGGHFLTFDTQAKKALVLDIVQIQKDKLNKTGEDTYNIPAEFKSIDGKNYIIDFTLKGRRKLTLKVSEIAIRVEDGKERFTRATPVAPADNAVKKTEIEIKKPEGEIKKVEPAADKVEKKN